jgi:hypothetical protein
MQFGEPFGGVIPGARGAVLATLLRTDAPLTGRQVHALVSDDYSLWTVQEALKALTQLGLVTTQTIGRAGVHTVNEDHVSVPHPPRSDRRADRNRARGGRRRREDRHPLRVYRAR